MVVPPNPEWSTHSLTAGLDCQQCWAVQLERWNCHHQNQKIHPSPYQESQERTEGNDSNYRPNFCFAYHNFTSFYSDLSFQADLSPYNFLSRKKPIKAAMLAMCAVVQYKQILPSCTSYDTKSKITRIPEPVIRLPILRNRSV